jgi:hypothetical protein
MVIKSSGTISLQDLATEYDVTEQPYSLSDFYKSAPSGKFTVLGSGLVGPVGSPNVPHAGRPISLNDFYSQKKRDTALLSFPPSAMTDYVTHLGSSLLTQSLAGVTHESLESQGWVFPSNASNNANGVSWDASQNVTTKAFNGGAIGIGVIKVTFVGSALEGGETVRISLTDGTNTLIVYENSSIVSGAENNITLDLLTISGIETINRSSSQLKIVFSTIMGVNDIMELRYIEALTAETYRSISESDRTSTLSNWKVFNKVITDTWQSADSRVSSGTYGTGIRIVSINGFTPPSYLGSWVGLTMPYPIYLESFEMTGQAMDFRLYASQNPSDTTKWDLIHTVTDTENTTGYLQITVTHTLSAVTSKPYMCFVIMINRTRTAGSGFGRVAINEITFNGYKA